MLSLFGHESSSLPNSQTLAANTNTIFHSLENVLLDQNVLAKAWQCRLHYHVASQLASQQDHLDVRYCSQITFKTVVQCDVTFYGQCSVINSYEQLLASLAQASRLK